MWLSSSTAFTIRSSLSNFVCEMKKNEEAVVKIARGPEASNPG